VGVEGAAGSVPSITGDLLHDKAAHYFKQLLSGIIKLPVGQIDSDVPLEEYGIDSIMVMQLTTQLEKVFGSLSKTLFFEYQNIQLLTDYFTENHQERLIKLMGLEEPADQGPTAKPIIKIAAKLNLVPRGNTRFSLPGTQKKDDIGDIAIIGLSGRYPGAKNIDEYWNNLRDGKDSITEIPIERWDHRLYFDEDRDKPGKTYCKWGGFMDGVEEFDPLFFNISPREAVVTDPQERLFLECVYETIEDAGYTRESLSKYQNTGLEGNVGVFVGVMYEEYQLYGAQEQILGRPIVLPGNPASIANRISYFFNFHGPSMAIDTMCSSSLTAIHLACKSINQGGCELAIAGGVNVSIHPNKYLTLGQGKFASSKGRCESFGIGGDGYVPGEGVGAVLLKPLSKAVIDGDHIYGIIKGTAINHGGKTNGYTVPNPNAQACVISQTIKEAGVDPRTISYVEAHGTGTVLGDPIEIASLTKIFREFTNDKQFCAIGSAKSNIGHCESAAGIAGVTKVLLQLKNNQLAPSLHSGILNPNIDFSNTPFKVQQGLAEWKRPVVGFNESAKEYPRIAGVSAFGAGGANAHVVIQEYIPQNTQPQFIVDSQNPAIIVLSAKDEGRLKDQVNKIIQSIEKHQITDYNLADAAYTLQVGRESMEERLAIIVNSVQGLKTKLQGFVDGIEDIEDLYRGQVKRNKEALAVFTIDEDILKAIDTWISKRKYPKILDLWVKGLAFDWNKLYEKGKPNRMSLPTYPFARERYWFRDNQANDKINAVTALLHPLLHQNTSDISGLQFSSTFTGEEFFLADHVVNGQKILPGVAYLEMAHVAAKLGIGAYEGQYSIQLKNVVWVRPISVNGEPVKVNIGLQPEDNGDIAYEIYTQKAIDQELVVHCQGIAMLSTTVEPIFLDIPSLQEECNLGILTGKQCYEAFKSMGIDYGPGHQGIEQVFIGKGQALARLSLPSVDTNSYVLHPGLMDSALQAAIGLLVDSLDMSATQSVKPSLPFALEQIEILGNCVPKMWVLVKYTQGSLPTDKVQKFDFSLCDGQGKICIRMQGFSSRVLEDNLPFGTEVPAHNTSMLLEGNILLTPVWDEVVINNAPSFSSTGDIIIVGGTQGHWDGIRQHYPQAWISGVQPEDCSEAITQKLSTHDIGHIIWLAPESVVTTLANECIIKGQDEGVIHMFRLIKAILHLGYGTKTLGWTIITTQSLPVNGSGNPTHASVHGLIGSMAKEYLDWEIRLADVQADQAIPFGDIFMLPPNKQGNALIYRQQKWYHQQLLPMVPSTENAVLYKKEGIYVVIGGAGGIGEVWSEYVICTYQAQVIWLGRREKDATIQAKLDRLSAFGKAPQYISVDATNLVDLQKAYEEIKQLYNHIDGIVHSAIVLSDHGLANMDEGQFRAGLSAKVDISVHIAQTFQNEPLDFVMFFSSMQSFFKAPGQSNYAAGCTFKDAFALQLARQWACPVKIINWGYWGSVGIVASKKYQERMSEAGIGSIEAPEAMEALETLLASPISQLALIKTTKPMNIEGVNTGEVISKYPENAPSIIQNLVFTPEPSGAINQDALCEKSTAYIKQLVSETLKMPVDKIDSSEPLEAYGIDSILVVQLTNALSKVLDHVNSTLFFEYQTIDALVEHFMNTQKQALSKLVGLAEGQDELIRENNERIPQAIPVLPYRKPMRFQGYHSMPLSKMENVGAGIQDIAIIGFSGRYPGAKNIHEFWNNLRDGKNCITEIPEDRWHWAKYYDQEKGKKGKMYTKWGGFIEDIDKFDPLFFQLSPAEAERMDPQERLFLEEVYASIQEAGYVPSDLCNNKKVGVFVGVMNANYPTGSSYWSIANRVSYLMNFQGPSISVDTACSSSLTAIHLALESIYSGTSECAIAGGVNLIVSPMHYLKLTSLSMLSSDDQCKAFGDKADGFIDGEGVGAIVLKPLNKAIEDKDHIYGIIKGSMLNAGGKTNGYTVPNPNAQFQLIFEVLQRAKIDARTISYVEAHGTGTKLGDPIEIAGLAKAFEKNTNDKQFCAIGSVKSNIGHSESASGIAGVTKVLLQLMHSQLVPSLHSKILNPNIDFSNTPFIVQQELSEWKRPVIEINGVTKEYPRIAGISSFGAGGANAHLVIEEYVSKEHVQITVNVQNPAIIVLSARDKDKLREQSLQIIQSIEKQQITDHNLADVAFTLQVGREAMEERLAVIVASTSSLETKLKGFVDGLERTEDLFRGQVKRNKEDLAIYRTDEDLATTIEAWINKRKYPKILDLWVKGLAFDWNKLYEKEKPCRISLPTYPFTREHYWAHEIQTDDNRANAAALLHPLLHRNTSDFSEQRFSSTFTGEEFFLANHVVNGQRILPGVAYLEMAREAAQQAVGTSEKVMLQLKNVVWVRPIAVNEEPVEVNISLYPEENGEVAYEVYTCYGDNDTITHSQGIVTLSSVAGPTFLDIAELQAQCSHGTLTHEQCYEDFTSMGMQYGLGHRGIEKVFIGDGQALAKLSLSSFNSKEQYILHPGVMDSALQASIGLLIRPKNNNTQAPKPLLPFALELIEVLSRCTPSMWALVRYSRGSSSFDKVQKLDIDLCDDQGKICVRMKGYSSRIIEERTALGENTNDMLILPPQDKVVPVAEMAVPLSKQGLLKEKATQYFKQLLSVVIKLPASRIEAAAPLEQYGIDSIMVMQMTNQLEKIFGSLSKTLFFEYQNIQLLTGFFIETYPEQLTKLLGLADVKAPMLENYASPSTMQAVNMTPPPRRHKRFASNMTMEKKGTTPLDIAIIGLAGRYPGAKNVAEFWNNLHDGKDCITEIPTTRWDHSLYFDEDKNKVGKTYCKWGGFIEGVEYFDSLFFNISPREAMILDPQERIFMECVHATLEDAGYTRESISHNQELGLDGNVGVFVGVMYEEYQLYGVQEQINGTPIALSGNSSSIANRVSYFFNLHGPSISLDTMCSSSLTAIHLGCKSLQQGACELVIAGGVNISIHPNKYLSIGQGKFASSKGCCGSFGMGGDGYVPGEGVGAVLLKPLSQALSDGDHIYGVIKGTAINHGGKTNGYTVPNPNAQAGVIAQALKEAGIDARAISYIEAHGTGTSLGDPIEITGLTKTFREYTKDEQYCAIGSAKSNIGHCESAAGIAGITKVLLQLKHGQLVPSLHSKILNPNIDFSRTPFIVQQELSEWKRPIIEANGATKEYPRIAGISAFGAGGANAHVIIEEYITSAQQTELIVDAQSPAIILLSARDETRLREMALQLLQSIEKQEITDRNLADAAFTLQVGREAMEERFAMIVESTNDLKTKLKDFIDGSEYMENVYHGQVKRNKEALAVFTIDEDLLKAIETWINKRKYPKILDLWVKGLAFDWNKLYEKEKPHRMSLPSYPFARERYWAPDTLTDVNRANAAALLHPLLHQNTSNFSEQRFSSSFTGEEFFFAHHVINGQRILPGVAYLEMAREAVQQSTSEKATLQLKNIIWVRPIAVNDETVKVNISLYPEENGEIAYEVYSRSVDSNTVIHNQGIAILSSVAEPIFIDIAALLTQCNQGTLTHDQCYDTFTSMNIKYGPGHRGIEQVFIGDKQALAKLSLSSVNFSDQYMLHPGLMDSALQASIGLLMASENNGNEAPKPLLPFALEQIDVLSRCTPNMWALVRYSQGSSSSDKVQKLDIDLCDDQGKICVRMKGYSSRIIEEGTAARVNTGDTLILQPHWQEKAASQELNPSQYGQRLVVICEQDKVSPENIERQIKDVCCLMLSSEDNSIDERYQSYAIRLFETIQGLINSKPKGKVLIQVVVPTDKEQRLLSGLCSMLKVAHLEAPNLIGQLIALDHSQDIIAALTENAGCPLDDHIRYENGRRLTLSWDELKNSANGLVLPWKDSGIYLITGGAGGLGLIFAKDIAEKTKNATLILTGRSQPDESRKAKLKALESFGVKVCFKQTDVTKKEAVEDLIEDLKNEHGTINGIIHSAGVVHDNYIIKKNIQEIREVMAPKITGLVNLDEASRGLSLDFFVLFSSTAATMGNSGQADYATANAFMDIYASYRNILVRDGQRQGHTLSINWPLWKEGGMHIDEKIEKMIALTTGMHPMQTTNGIHSFYQCLASKQDQLIVVEGELSKIRQKGGSSVTPVTAQPISAPVTGIDTNSLQDKVQKALLQTVSKLLKIRIEDLDPHTELNEYGFDSIAFTEFSNLLNQQYKLELTPTIFFEYSDINALAIYLAKEYKAVFAEKFAVQTNTVSSPIREKVEKIQPMLTRGHSRFAPSITLATQGVEQTSCPIAIVGMSGVFPMARDLNEFWENLLEGKNCISEIPPDRWDWQEYYGDPLKESNKTNIKWGGFMDHIDEFDPLFFGISPREATFMDPQQRFLMAHVWKAIEDAGYSAQSLSGTKTGIFAGTSISGYSALINKANIAIESYTSTGVVPSIGPNRMSYFLNIHGPSVPIETACSSSLIAIHQAVSSISNGSCEMAVVGGINTIVTPDNHISFNKTGMLAPDGLCKTFSDKANGYVRGEGVGMLFLKKLNDAEMAGDHIYGVILGTAENHGGRANSLTSPNPKAQAELLKAAYAKAGIDPRTVTYIEAHGTGTELGDPIEINGLKTAFREMYEATGSPNVVDVHCAVGSVKTNIGHLELASGIAGVIKVLLQLKHKTLVKSLHCDTVNPYIQLKGSPFYLLHETEHWKALQDSEGKELPRRAGISSFGFGGVNAHVVIEEYISRNQQPRFVVDAQSPAVILLSAKDETRLREMALMLLQSIEKQEITGQNLADAAFTLQVGREAMEERLALIVESVNDLKTKLNGFIDGSESRDNTYRGQVKRNKDALAVFTIDEELQEAIEKWVHRKKYPKILGLWVKGLSFDWNKLYEKEKPHRISLPTYPFARERYWVPDASPLSGLLKEKGAADMLHPLLHQNTSDILGLQFGSTLTGKEFFLADHVVKGQKILPGVAYLEMAHAAAQQAILKDNNFTFQLKNVVWIRPIAVNGKPVQVNISLFPGNNEEVAYEIYTHSAESGPVTHSQGIVMLRPMTEQHFIDIKALQDECNLGSLSSEQCYDAFKSMGVNYGSGHRGIDTIYLGAERVLAKLSLPSSIVGTKDQYVLHPCLMDSALQASMGLILPSTSSGAFRNPIVPFALEQIEVFDACTPNMWALVRYCEGSAPLDKVQKLDIDLCNDQGKLCVRMQGFSSRILEGGLTPGNGVGTHAVSPGPLAGDTLLSPIWDVVTIEKVPLSIPEGRVIIIGGTQDHWDTIRLHFPGALTPGVGYQDSFDDIVQKLGLQPIGHIIWIAPGLDADSMANESIITGQEHGAMLLFRFIKAIIGLGYQTKTLEWSIITIQTQPIHRHDPVNPTHSSLHGLTGSMAKEYPGWKIRLVDSQAHQAIPFEDIFTHPSDKQGNAMVYRGRQWYRQQLIPFHVPIEEIKSYKAGGVYVIIGGAGGIGEVWSEYVMRTYQAQVIWLGRREKDAAIQDKLDRLSALGHTPCYISADATNLDSLQKAYEEIKQQYKQINGVVHSAIVLLDKSLANMEEASFKAGLSAKVDVSVHIAQVFQKEPLDFVMFFSSMQSFLKAPGQSNYAAGCTFKDSFALQLAQQWPCPVKIMNWGYWGSVGIVSSKEYQQRMASAGIGSIEPPKAMEALEVLLGGSMEQLAFVNTTRPLTTGGHTGESFSTERSNIASVPLPTGHANLTLVDSIQAILIGLVAQTLKTRDEDIEAETPLIEYGFDQVAITEFTHKINEAYKLGVNPTVVFEQTTIARLAGYLLKEYRGIFEQYGLDMEQAHPAITPAQNDIVQLSQSTAIKEGPTIGPATKDHMSKTSGVPNQEILREKSITYIKNLISETLQLPPNKIDPSESLEKYGIDSISSVQLANSLSKVFNNVNSTIFFEHQTIVALVDHFIQTEKTTLVNLVGINHEEKVDLQIQEMPESTDSFSSKKTRRFTGYNPLHVNITKDLVKTQDIAIIGLSGRYPGANNIQEFWQNLRDGKDCITEIPNERWDNNLYFDENKNMPGKTYCKWGGFMDGVDQFDPLFFNISPRESEVMDPMIRLFLETTWNLFEDAGYTRESLSHVYKGKIGVYVGAMYQHYAFDSDIIRESFIALTSYSSIANRVSHFFNFQGPSIAIDTMCSSSLIAIHMACESLVKGESEMAIAGGVNLTIHPKKYLGLSLTRMIGSHSNCRSFGDGDGFLPAEGVGAVLLKPLREAIRDRDSVLAIIKSTATNHGGHANGYGIPNPSAQTQLIEDNFKKSGIDPRTISYVESAANGTGMGDAIEVNAISKAFQKFTSDQHFCAIGSVKSNIGHAEAASGISQLTKVILQLQHHQLVPSIKAEPLNPNINFKGTPFFLQKELAEWKRPTGNINGGEQEYPRRATVSSFGAGGSNAHLIVEEYIPEHTSNLMDSAISPQIIILSAKNENRLQVVVEQMLGFLEIQPEIALTNLAYTLQLGREAMEYRLAMVVNDMAELVLYLKAYLQSILESKEVQTTIPIYKGNLSEDNSELKNLLSGKAGEMVVQVFINENNLDKIALYWVQGGKIPWESFYQKGRVQKLHLPNYPFEKRRCWVETAPKLEITTVAVSELSVNVTDTLKDRVINLIASLLGMQQVELNIQRPLDQYGLDSILLMQLLQQLQAQINPSVDLPMLQECKTTQDVINCVHPRSVKIAIGHPTIPNAWPQFPELIKLNNRSDGRPVFWFHAALGGVEGYLFMAEKSQRPFYGIQARGWMTDQSPLYGIQAMATYYTSIIQSVQPEGPYDLGGYSLGGMLAYEITRQLQTTGQVVNSIVMIDSMYCPEIKTLKYSHKSSILQAINISLISPESEIPPFIHRDEVSNIVDVEFFNHLIELAKTRGSSKTEAQLRNLVEQSIKIQEAYEIADYDISPLPKPDKVTCYYFRNKNGLFLGELEPFFTIEEGENTVDHVNYWDEWEKQLPCFHLTEVDSSSHMALMSEEKSLVPILAFCETLYSGKGITLNFSDQISSITS
jgi:acyl transferase domain-containing protein/thioesterase domain-containing protein